MFRLSVVLVMSLWLGSVARGQEPAHAVEGMRVPASQETAAKKQVAPLGLYAAEAFQAGRNLHDLGAVTAELVAAQQETESEPRPSHP